MAKFYINIGDGEKTFVDAVQVLCLITEDRSPINWTSAFSEWPDWMHDAHTSGFLQMVNTPGKPVIWWCKVCTESNAYWNQANPTNWIVRYNDGTIYPCSDKQFKTFFEPVNI